MEEKGIEPPVFYKGAEVYYFAGMGKAEMVPELCIEGTNILLLEMPFAQWDKGVVEDVKFLVQKRKLTLIIAHIERYYPFQKTKNIGKPYLIFRCIRRSIQRVSCHGEPDTGRLGF